EIRTIATRRIGALVTVAVFTRTKFAAWPRVALAIPAVALRAVIPVETRRTIAEIATRRTAILALPGIGPAFAAIALVGEAALGEFLFGPPRRPRAAFAAAARPITPGIVVFIVVAGHERARFGTDENAK